MNLMKLAHMTKQKINTLKSTVQLKMLLRKINKYRDKPLLVKKGILLSTGEMLHHTKIKLTFREAHVIKDKEHIYRISIILKSGKELLTFRTSQLIKYNDNVFVVKDVQGTESELTFITQSA